MKLITLESFYELVSIDDARISPDGTKVVFVRTSIDRSGNKYSRTIWIKDLTSDAPAEPLTGSTKDGSPRWSPDGKRLAFISGRDDKPQVFVLPMSGGEARAVTTHPNGVNSFEWSPDSQRIAFTANMRKDEQDNEDKRNQKSEPADERREVKDAFELKQEKERKEHEEKKRFDPRQITRVPYRTGTTYIEDKWQQIFVVDVPQRFSTPNEAKAFRVTEGESSFTHPSWSTNGESLFSTLTREPDNARWYAYHDVVRVPVSKSESQNKAENVKRLTREGHSCYDPKVSPDGKWVAFQRSLEDRLGHRVRTIAVLSLSEKELQERESHSPTDLTLSLDRSVLTFEWSRDSQHIYFNLEQDGNTRLWRVNLKGETEQLTHLTHDVFSFGTDAGGRVVFVASTPRDPCALFLRETDGTIRPLVQPNEKFLREHVVCDLEEMHYASDEFEIEGWFVKPPGFDENKKYPLVVEIHGGPHVQWTPSFRSMFHEWQMLAQRGYVVFFCNPRGSDGYGEAFTAANWKDWGNGAMRDVMRGVDELIARGFVDTERLCVTGGSYGGYLTTWIIGHTDRFKAAVSQRGVYNLISMRGTTDIPIFNDFESGVTPWEDVNKLWEMSPLAYAPQITTPLLIEHSEQDYRVPIEQAEQLFQALWIMKKTVEMVRWPREGHEISRSGEPKHRLERLKRIVEWFEKYVNSQEIGVRS